MNAMGTTHAQSVLEFKRSALAGFAELLHVGQNNVERLRDLVRQRGVTQVGRSHAIVHPTAGLFFAFGNIGIDAFSHVREERNNVVVRHGLNLGNTIDGEVRMVANPLCVFLGDAALPPSAWASHASSSISFQMLNLFSSSQMAPMAGRV